MDIATGMLFAFGAMICWGVGDFFIQRATRTIGDWETLFFITFIGAIVLTPFVWNDIPALFQTDAASKWIVMISAVAIFLAALFDFEAIKEGKLAIIEPVLALEVPITAGLAMLLAGEFLGLTEMILILVIMTGIFLVSSRFGKFSHKMLLEKGVIIGLLGALLMGASNFFIGFGARITDPLMINWFINVVMALLCVAYIWLKIGVKHVVKDLKKNKGIIAKVSVIDNAAWIFYAFAAASAPIAIVVAVSESYIAVAAILGLMINHEMLMRHQKLGLALSVVGSIVLAVLAG